MIGWGWGLGMSGWTGWCGYSLSHGQPWLAAHVTGGGCLDLFTLCSRVRHWDRLWSSAIKGEGDSVGCFGLLLPHPVDTALKPV